MRKLFYAGDSTVKFNKIDTYPQMGLSQGIQLYLKDDVVVRSYAENGRSTKSFINEGRLSRIAEEISEGDFLFIEFGHNDEKEADPTRYAAAETDYKDNLKKFVSVAKEHGAYPVIITPVARRVFDENGKISPTHGKYPACAIEAAKECGVPYIDLTSVSERYLESVGDYASRPMYVYPKDNSHLTMHGAVVFSGFIADGLRRIGEPYAGLLVPQDTSFARNYNDAEVVD